MSEIRFETWKGRRAIVSRSGKNRINTYRYQKGSGIKSKVEAQRIMMKTGTFYEDRVRIGSTTTRVEDVDQIVRLTNVGIIQSKKIPKKTTAPHQYIARVSWQVGKRTYKTEGYSNIINKRTRKDDNTYNSLGNKRQAFERARGTAVQQQIITYDYDIHFITSERGVAKKGDKEIWFKVQYEVQTFIRLGEKK